MAEYLRNIWYMGAWAHEVTRAPLSRRLLGVNTLFYRKEDGAPVALRDRCPHRFAPLSRGKIVGDDVQCPYHGLVFDGAGQCVRNPLDGKIPAAAKVQSFPVAEKDKILWFWPGDPQKADPALIPDFSYLMDDVTYKHVFGITHMKTHYELETDNLMDLGHIEMLHPQFGGVLGPNSKYTLEQHGNTVHSNWFTRGAKNPIWAEQGSFPTHGAPIDHWLEMRWDAPGAMYLEVSVTKTGEPRAQGYTNPSVHILTPETEETTHYFWSSGMHSHEPIPPEVFREGFIMAFEQQDKPMLELVAGEMETTDLWSLKPILLPTDAGAVRARRVLADMIAKEKAETGARAAAE